MIVNNEPIENTSDNTCSINIAENPIQILNQPENENEDNNTNVIKKNYDVNLLKTEILSLKNELEKKLQENMLLQYEMTQNNKKKEKTDVDAEIDSIINSNSISYVRSAIFYIKIWNFFAGLFVTLKYIILILIVPTLTFASTTYTQNNLNFVAGISSLTGLAFEKMGNYCEINSKRRVEKLNKILQEHGNLNKIQDDSDFEVDDKHNNLSDNNSQEETKRSFKLKSTVKSQNQRKSAKNVCVVAFGENI
jgi:hypothetical protein